MTPGITNTAIISVLYTALIFMIAWYAHCRKESGRSIVGSPYIYTLSIAVYCTSWTFYGSVGKAASTGLDFIMIYLGPTLTVFLWFFLLRRIIRISKENNITNITDFISLRYGKSLWLGAITTLLVLLGIMPYIALQIKAVSVSFYLISGFGTDNIHIPHGPSEIELPTGLLLTIILAVFSVVFGARRLQSSERHEGLIAAVSFESLIKLLSLILVGIYVSYYLFNGFTDIFTLFRDSFPDSYKRLLTFNYSYESHDQIPAFTMLIMSMGAFIMLPRQFHVMIIENSDEHHIEKAMMLFPIYLFLIAIFIMPIALAGIIMTGSSEGADFFVINLPLLAGNENIAKIAFLGGLSASAGMVIVESIAISTMLLNNFFMPVIVRLKPQTWFPFLLINLKRLGIFLVVFLGYFYYRGAGESLSLAEMGLISFAASCQLLPVFVGALFWKHGNRTGAITGITLGFATWFYTLLLPSFKHFEWFQTSILTHGPFGIAALKPTALFGMHGMDLWSHSLFWSLFFNISAYVLCSITLGQDELERDQIRKFFSAVESERRQFQYFEPKRLSKPVTINKFVALMAKFIGEIDANIAINNYLDGRDIDINGNISEFELPKLKRFTEKTLAGSVGAAAAGAIVDSFLSDMGSRMESVYNIFSSVRTSLDQSREALFVRLRASEIINRTLDIQIIMNDLLELLTKEFKLEIALIQLREPNGTLTIKSHHETSPLTVISEEWLRENSAYFKMVINDGNSRFVNDCSIEAENIKLSNTISSGILSFAHIPIKREGESTIGIISIISKSIKGLFTEEFLDLLTSLAGQLAQAITIVSEVEAKEVEREQKEMAILKNARVIREMEIAQQIQISLLPCFAPDIPGIEINGRCISAAHVGGDYFDFIIRDDNILDILIADVSGHSVGAALIMSEVRTMLRLHTASTYKTSELLQILNNQLYEDLTRVELFISLFYAKFNNKTNRLSFANAGHNLPIIYRNGYSDAIELDAEGMIIGVKEDVEFIEQEIELINGDVILFYTDGLVEATNPQGDLFGTKRIFECLIKFKHLQTNDIIESLYSEIRSFTNQESLQDDISIIVLKVMPTTNENQE